MTHFLGHAGGQGDELDVPEGRLLLPEEVARYLRVDKETLRRWRRQRTGPPVILCGRATPRYPENGLIIWMRDNTQLCERGRLAS
jgi:hypothetical protein